jgi:hypothetical protein
VVGLYNLRIFVRGKPWVISIDDFFLVEAPNTENWASSYYERLIFAHPGSVTGALWAALLEKAWAKTAGNYDLIQGSHNSNTLRFLTGAPVITYQSTDYTNQALYETIKAADSLNYPITATTGPTNVCGLALDFGFSILSAFEMIE